MCYMLQSCVQFEDYSVVYFDCIHCCVVQLLLRVLLNYMEILYTFEVRVPSPQWKSSSTMLRMWQCEQNMRWNNWFLHYCYILVYVHSYFHSLAHSITNIYNWQTPVYCILMVKESIKSLFSFTFTPQNGEEDMLSEGQHSILSHIPRFTECLEWRQSTEQSFYQHRSLLGLHKYMMHYLASILYKYTMYILFYFRLAQNFLELICFCENKTAKKWTEVHVETLWHHYIAHNHAYIDTNKSLSVNP